MTDNDVTLSREQVREIFNALRGIGNLMKGLVSRSANASESYAITSNLALIQATLSGRSGANPN
jgi:hypothetical protein